MDNEVERQKHGGVQLIRPFQQHDTFTSEQQTIQQELQEGRFKPSHFAKSSSNSPTPLHAGTGGTHHVQSIHHHHNITHRSMNDLDNIHTSKGVASSDRMAQQQHMGYGAAEGYDQDGTTNAASTHPAASSNLSKLHHESLHHGAIPGKALSHSGPPALVQASPRMGTKQHMDETSSVISFTSSVHSLNYDSASVVSSSVAAAAFNQHRPTSSGGIQNSNHGDMQNRAEDIHARIKCVESLSAMLGGQFRTNYITYR